MSNRGDMRVDSFYHVASAVAAPARTPIALLPAAMRRPLHDTIRSLGALSAIVACTGTGAVMVAGGTSSPASPTSPAWPTSPPPPLPCGATQAQKCPVGRGCSTAADCESGICNTIEGPGVDMCVSARSCILTPGADQKCGRGTEDCCASPVVPGGRYVSTDIDGNVEAATVSTFALDAFEVTVGRLRAFYTDMAGNLRGHPPAEGAGAHPKIRGSGWRASFDVRLPGSWAEIDERHVAACSVGGDNAHDGATTWTETPGPNEDKPINCVDWYTMFAFCIWDGGRLPTDAEWGYVATSGEEKRTYPYGSAPPTFDALQKVVAADLTSPPDAIYMFTQGPPFRGPTDGPLQIAPVGRKSERSKWGHADMTGNVLEMTMDLARTLPATCTDCANVAWPNPPQGGPPTQPPKWQTVLDDGGLAGGDLVKERATQDGIRIARGASWQGERAGHPLANGANRHLLPVWRTDSAAGGRCARDVAK